jgi:UDP-N-acetylglucosamine:LPS N-acetylglucosamine transferase
MIEQREATPEITTSLVLDLVENSGARATIQSALAGWHSPKAADEIARIILEKLNFSASD